MVLKGAGRRRSSAGHPRKGNGGVGMSDVVGNPLVKFKKQLPKVEAKKTLSQQQTELVIKKKKEKSTY